MSAKSRDAVASPQYLEAYDRVLAQWPIPTQQIDLATPYGITRVNACGPADAPPVILLHGGGGATSTVWADTAAELSTAHRVYAPDLMGHPGRSVRGGTPITSARDIQDWLESILTGLGAVGADLCGHSYGGWLALTYALRFPDRVRKLALLDPTACFTGFAPGYLLRALPILLRPTPRAVRGFLAWETGSSAGIQAAALDPDWLDLAALGADFPAARVVGGRKPSEQSLRPLAPPTLLVLADRSRAHDVRRVEARARRALKDLTVGHLPRATHHSLPGTDPEELNRMLTDFLA